LGSGSGSGQGVTMFQAGDYREPRLVSAGAWTVPRDGSSTPAPAPNRRLRAILVDPDALARHHLRQLLEEDAGCAVVGECASGGSAVDATAEERPDLVFLEVALPDVDGFALAGELQPYLGGGVVFVTDQAQGALHAFDLHALDYVLKPVHRERLCAAVAHVRSLLGGDRRDSGSQERLIALLDRRDAERQRRTRLLIRHSDGAFFIRTEAIDWVEAAGKLVKVHADKHVHAQRETLARIERHLDPDRFVRISRSAIVNIDRIREIQSWFNGEYLVILDDHSQVSTSRHYRANLRRLLRKDEER
jgi:two-component system LytT family response regulator